MSATDVEVWLLTAACHMPNPGIAAMFCHQYVKRLTIVAATRLPSSSQVIAVICFHTEE